MNRRSFLKFAGLAPVVPGLAVGVLKQSKKFVHTFNWEDDLVDVLTWKDGAWSFWLKAHGQDNLERVFVDDVEVELARQGDIGRVWYSDPIIRIDHECNCRNIPIPEPRTTATTT